MFAIYTPLFPRKPEQDRTQFAQAALRDAFRGRDLCLAREPDFIDHTPQEVASLPPTQEVTTKEVTSRPNPGGNHRQRHCQTRRYRDGKANTEIFELSCITSCFGEIFH